MTFAYLKPSNLQEAWQASKDFMKAPHDPLSEYERIADNRPHPGIDPNYPKNTDGTLAAIIQEQPKRIIQQTPTGVLKSNDPRKWLPIVANWVMNEQLIPRATSQADPLQKSWAMGQKTLTYGAQLSTTFFGGKNDWFGADFKIPYIKDIYFESGKLTWQDCNYGFIRAWYQKGDVEAIIAKERRLRKAAKERGEEYEPTWDVTVLKEALDLDRKKTSQEQSRGEYERNVQAGGIEIVHAMQDGVGAKFYSFLPALDGKVCRTKVNKDPRGVMPIQAMYANIDLSNPLGRGAVELSGGMQNFIDSTMQAYQYIMGLMMNPPLKKRGSVVVSSLKYKMNAVWDMGSQPNNDVEPVNINNAAINNFAQIYGLAKSQIMNLNNSADTSVSSEVGNPGFSKTDAGVDALQARLGVSDNYMRKQYETWWSDVLESMVNIHFAEKNGIEVLDLDQETADKLRAINPGLVNDDNQFELDYDEIEDVPFHFAVDASSSNMEDKQAQVEALDGLLARIDGSQMLGQMIPADKVIALWNAVVAASGVESPEKIAIDQDELDQMMNQPQIDPMTGQPIEPAIDPATGMPMEQPAIDPTTGQPLPPDMGAIDPSAPQTDVLPVDGEAVPGEVIEDGVVTDEELALLSDEELELVDELQSRGVPDTAIEQAIIMLQQDMPVEEVAAIVMQSLQEEQAPQEVM